MIIVKCAAGKIIFLIFLFRMELYLRVVASSLAVCLFTTNVAIERIMVKFKSRIARIIQWIARNEKVWDITTAIYSQFVFPQLHAIIVFNTFNLFTRSSGIEFSWTTLYMSSSVTFVQCQPPLVFRISINFSPLSSSGSSGLITWPPRFWVLKKSVWGVG